MRQRESPTFIGHQAEITRRSQQGKPVDQAWRSSGRTVAADEARPAAAQNGARAPPQSSQGNTLRRLTDLDAFGPAGWRSP